MPTFSAPARRSGESRAAPKAAASATATNRSGSQRAASAIRAKSATGAGAFSFTSSTSAPGGICFASDGCTASRTPRSVVPMSTRVIVTLPASSSNTARWRSLTPARKIPWNAPVLTIPATTLSSTGRTATRSGSACTNSSATLTATSSLTASLASAALARSAN